jgi:hypothetical protein
LTQCQSQHCPVNVIFSFGASFLGTLELPFNVGALAETSTPLLEALNPSLKSQPPIIGGAFVVDNNTSANGLFPLIFVVDFSSDIDLLLPPP